MTSAPSSTTPPTKIRVGTGATGKDLKALQGDFKAVVSDVPTDFGSASTAIADLNTRLGLSGKPLRRLSKQMLDLSRLTETDVGENVESVTRLFGDWSVKTGQQSKTLDKLFRVSQATGIGVSDLSRSMVSFGSPLRQLGFDFDRAAAMFAQFEKDGVNVQTLMPGLKFALKNLSGASPKVTDELKRLGVSLKDPSVALEQVFKLIKDAPSDLKANALAFKVFGQRAGPDMAAAVREGRFDLDKLLRTMRGGKDTIRGAARDTEDLSEKWIKFKNKAMVALEPVAKRVFEGVAREADKLFKVLADPKLTFDEKLEAVMGRASDAIRAAMPKIADAAAKAAPHIASGFVQGFLGAGVWGRLLVTGFLLKKMGGLAAFRTAGVAGGAAMGTGMAAGMTPAVAGGPLKGRLATMFRGWGPLLGASLAATFGPEIVKKLGDVADRVQAGRTSEKIASTVAGARNVREEIAALDKRIAVLRENDTAMNRNRNNQRELTESLQAHRAELAKQVVANDKLNHSLDMRRGSRLVTLALRSMRSAAQDDLGAVRAVVRNSMGAIRRLMDEDPKAGAAAMRGHFRGAVRAMATLLKSGKIDASTYLKQIQGLAKLHSKGARENIAANFAGAVRAIRGAMRSGQVATADGLEKIRALSLKALAMYGFSSSEARKLFRAGVDAKDVAGGKDIGGALGKGPQGLPGRARGGLVGFGTPGGAGRDTIPANIGGQNVAVGSGEVAAVFNRHQLPVLNARLSDMGGLPGFFKRHDRPHYMARGGYVQGASPPSGSGSGPIRALAEQLFNRGFSVTSGGEYRGSGTYHDQQRALDFGDSVNSMPGLWKALYPKRSQTAELFGPSALPGGGLYNSGTKFADSGLQAMHEDHIHVALLSALSGALGKGGAAVAAKLRRVLVRGPDSPLKAVVQGSLDAAHNAAQQRLSQIAERSGAGTGQALDIGAGGNYQGPLDRNFGENSSTTIGFNQAAMLAEKAGLPGVTYAQIAQGESGLRPGAVSPDGGYGLWQMTPRVQSAATVSKWESIGSYFNPWNNARMAKVLAGSGTGVSNYYGTGFVTDYNKHYTGPMNLARGGMLEMFTPGGLVGRPAGRMPSRADVTGQARTVTANRRTLEELTERDDPKRKKALAKLEKSRAAAKKELVGSKRKLARMRKRRGKGLKRQKRRQGKYTALLEGLDVPAGMVDQFDRREFDLEDAETLADQARQRYEADERITPETLQRLLGPDMGGLSEDDRKSLIGSTQSILEPSELNDLLGRQQGLLTGYEAQKGLAERITDAIGGRIPKVERLIASMRKRVRANMEELKKRLAEIEKARKLIERKQDRLKAIRGDIKEIRGKKKPTGADQRKLDRLVKEAAAIGEQTPGLQTDIERDRQRIPVLEADNRFLTDVARPKGMGTGGLHGEAKMMLDESLKDDLDRFGGLLRPSGIPDLIANTGLNIAQLRLEGAWSPERSDPSGSADAAESAGLLRELLQQQTQRLAVSERGFDVLRNFPAFAGVYHDGGIIPGPASRESVAIVRGQEMVLNREQQAALAPAAGGDVQVIVHGDIISDRRDPVEVMVGDRRFTAAVKKVTRGESRGAIRGLPSGGGGRY